MSVNHIRKLSLRGQVTLLLVLLSTKRSKPKGGVLLEVLPPQAVHRYQCPSTRFGKKFGPCDCGGTELNREIDRVLRVLINTVKFTPGGERRV